METRRPVPWAWILGTLALVLIVGAIAYWLGAHRGVLVGRLFFGGPTFGFGLLGILAVAVIVALVVGVVVAAVTRDSVTTTMSYEEWHRRAHAAESGAESTAPTVAQTDPPSVPPDDAVT
jgi:uncharacterized membrane protein